jgi:hypothetical protein
MLHLSLISLLSLLPLAGVFDLLAENLSIREAGLYLRKELTQDDVLVQYFMNHPSLYFYTTKDSFLVQAPIIPRAAGQETLNERVLSQLWGDTRRVIMLIGRWQEIVNPLPQEIYNLYEAHDLIVLSNHREKNLRSNEQNVLAVADF